LHHLRDKARHWSKIVIFFHTPLAFDAPVRGGAPRRNIAIPFGVGKLHRVSKKTLHFCFCQNFVKFPRILINVGR